MNPDAPSDRPNTNAQPPEPPAARQAAYPSDLAALVLKQATHGEYEVSMSHYDPRLARGFEA